MSRALNVRVQQPSFIYKMVIQIGIKRLEDKEAQLKAINAAFYAGRPRETGTARKTSVSPADNRRHHTTKPTRRLRCFICDEAHRMRECEFLEEIRGIASQLVAKSKGKSVGKGKYAKHLKHQRGYAADEVSSSDSAESDPDEDYADDTAALSKEQASKVPRSDWVADSGASSHMTDQHRLFSTPLTRIKRRYIKVGGGRLHADYCGTVRMCDQAGNSALLSSVLYVPQLGVNLLSGKRMCGKGLRGSFDEKALYMHDRHGNLAIEAREHGGVYIVNHIAKGLDEFALAAMLYHDVLTTGLRPEQAYPAGTHQPGPASSLNASKGSVNISEGSMNTVPVLTGTHQPGPASSHDVSADTLPVTSEEPPTANNVTHGQHRPDNVTYRRHCSDLYKLWHRRFAHLGSAKLSELHKVTTLEKPIPIVHDDNDVCEVCALTKFLNRRGHTVSERKAFILALVSIDVCGPLPLSRDGYSYFLEIVDNHSRKVWTLALNRREDAPDALRKWRLQVELQTGAKVMSVRSDNATELKSVLDGWCSSFGVVPEYTVPYMSIQNGVAERSIRTTENAVPR